MTLGLGIDRKAMGDKHEQYLAELFGGRMSRGSGNQWREPADGRHDHHAPYAFAWDGKSTMASALSVSRATWTKLVEQAGGERPMLGLRFYDTHDLDVGVDLVAVRAEDFAEMREEVLRLRKELAEEQESHRETEEAYLQCRAEREGVERELGELKRITGRSILR